MPLCRYTIYHVSLWRARHRIFTRNIAAAMDWARDPLRARLRRLAGHSALFTSLKRAITVRSPRKWPSRTCLTWPWRPGEYSHPPLRAAPFRRGGRDSPPPNRRSVTLTVLPGDFRFSGARIIIIFHGSIPLPLGDIVLPSPCRGSPRLMRPGDKLSALAWFGKGSRRRYQPAAMELQAGWLAGWSAGHVEPPPPRRRSVSVSLSPSPPPLPPPPPPPSPARVPRWQFTSEFHCRRMPPAANGSPRSNIRAPNSLPNSLRNTFLMNYCCRKWK